MFEKRRLKKLQKLLKFHGIEKSLDEIRLQKINTVTLAGVLFIIKAVSQWDYLIDDPDIGGYSDLKEKKRHEQNAKLAEKDTKTLKQLDERNRERLTSLFSKAVLKPDPEKFDVQDWYYNFDIAWPLYNAIVFNTIGKKKLT